MYKSKLNELCQRKGWGMPVYSCIKDGEDHNPDFRASVIVNGSTFVSPDVHRSSKSAHNGAAEVAVAHFVGSFQEQHTTKKQKAKDAKIPTMNLSSDFDTGISTKNGSFGSPEENENAAKPADSQVTISPPNLSALTISELGPKTSTEDSYLLGNRVRVYTTVPLTGLPKGTVVLPFDTDKWAVVSLEFP